MEIIHLYCHSGLPYVRPSLKHTLIYRNCPWLRSLIMILFCILLQTASVCALGAGIKVSSDLPPLAPDEISDLYEFAADGSFDLYPLVPEDSSGPKYSSHVYRFVPEDNAYLYPLAIQVGGIDTLKEILSTNVILLRIRKHRRLASSVLAQVRRYEATINRLLASIREALTRLDEPDIKRVLNVQERLMRLEHEKLEIFERGASDLWDEAGERFARADLDLLRLERDINEGEIVKEFAVLRIAIARCLNAYKINTASYKQLRAGQHKRRSARSYISFLKTIVKRIQELNRARDSKQSESGLEKQVASGHYSEGGFDESNSRRRSIVTR